jgi:hypothetical protein
MENLTRMQLILIGLAAMWELVWKGFALWRASQREEKQVFVALLILNTLGLFPMLYLYLTRKRKLF